MSRIGHNYLRGAQTRARASAPIQRALDAATRQQGHSIRKRLEVCCKMSAKDAHDFPDRMDVLFAPVVEHMLDVWDDDSEDINAATLIAFLKELQTKDPDLLMELFSFVALCCTGAAMEGFVAGTIYGAEKRQTVKRARQSRPGR